MFASFVQEYDASEFRRCHVEFVGQLKHKHLYHLVGEVDRCLKKVGEGVETVEELWKKFEGVVVSSQKEKLQNELKKEIKKLQRLREQIKSWISSTDIKDKTMLVDTRKLIEMQMERFKEIEREMKIKTYSKIGLGSAPKIDPIVQESEDLNLCISNWMEELEIQIDHFELEMERLLGTTRRNGQREDRARLEELQTKVERHKFHIKKLETLMKMLDDLGSDVDYSAVKIKHFLDDVQNIKEDMDYYLSNNNEPDFTENNDIYKDIDGIDEFELSTTCFRSLPTHSVDDFNSNSKMDADLPSLTSDKDSKMCAESSDVDVLTGTMATTPESPSLSIIKNQATAEINQEREYGDSNGSTVLDSVTTNPMLTTPITSSFKDVLSRYTPLYTRSVSKMQEMSFFPSPYPVMSAISSEFDGQNDELTPDSGSPCPTLSEDDSTMSDNLDTDVNTNDLEMPHMRNHFSESNGDKAIYNASAVKKNILPERSSTKLCPSNISFSLVRSQGFESLITHHHSQSGEKKETIIPPLFGAAPLGPVPLGERHRQCFERLLASERQLPMLSCAERLGQVLPRENCTSPKYYPQTPLPSLSSGAHFRLLDIETLFFIFYYSEGSMGQYLAAKELKERSWRFHTKDLTWYQRDEVPEQVTDDYEIGTYVYFDFGKWCQRRKKNFYFEYRYLEHSY